MSSPTAGMTFILAESLSLIPEFDPVIPENDFYTCGNES